MAEAAGVQLNYICSDALNIPNEGTLGHFDIVLMEFGILHDFTDLNAVFSVVNRRLCTNGRCLLTDYHPFAKAWRVINLLKYPTGNYFDDSIHEDLIHTTGKAFIFIPPQNPKSQNFKELLGSRNF